MTSLIHESRETFQRGFSRLTRKLNNFPTLRFLHFSNVAFFTFPHGELIFPQIDCELEGKVGTKANRREASEPCVYLLSS